MAVEKNTLLIEISSKGAEQSAKRLNAEMQKMEVTGDKAATSADNLGKSAGTASTAVTSLGKSTSSTAKNIDQASTSMGGLSKQSDTATGAARGMDLAYGKLAATMSAVVIANAAISKSDAFQGYENRLKLVVNGQEQLNKAMTDTFAIAQGTRQQWDSVVQVYQRFSENAKTLGLDMKKTAELTETVSKAVAISGASTQASEAALTQFGQSLASSVFRGEEFNSVAEQTPALLKAIAAGLNVNIGQLRSMAAEGRLTSDVLVTALTKSKDSVDELFAKTSITIGQSMTMMDNAVVKFVGEAGKTSGAALAISQSIQLVANNLDTVFGTAMLGGIALITRAILLKGSAIRKSAVDTAAASVAAKTLRDREIELAKAAAVDAKAHLESVRVINAATQARFGATAAALRYKTALDQVNATQSKVDNLTGKISKLGSIGSGALSLVGGSIGAITLGVTAASAAYGYFAGKAEEATKKLAEQAEVADRTDESLRKLTGTEKIKAVESLTVTFADQEKQLRKHEVTMGSALVKVENYYGVMSEEAKVAREARTGIISYDEALKKLNQLEIKKDMYDRLTKELPLYDEISGKIQNTSNKLKLFGEETVIAGNKAQNSAVMQRSHEDAIDAVGNAAERASKKLSEYNKSSQMRYIEAQMELDYVAQGRTVSEAKALIQAAKDLGGLDSVILSKEQIDNELKIQKIQSKTSQIEADRNKAASDKNKQLEKQNKLIAQGNRLVGISGDTGIGKAHVDIRYGGSKAGQKPTAEHISRIQAGGKGLQSYRMSSGYGPRDTGIKGASKFHKGIDYAVPKGTPLTTNVAVKSIKKWFDKKGGGYVSTITFEDGVVLQLLHQSPDMMGKVSEGASGGKSSSLTLKQEEQQLKQQQRERENLLKKYGTEESGSILERDKDLTDSKSLGLSSLGAAIKARFEAQRKLAAEQLDFEINGYKWNEQQKLDYETRTKKLRLDADGKYSAAQTEIIKAGIDAQADYQMKLYERNLVQEEIAYNQSYTDRMQKAADDLLLAQTTDQVQLAKLQDEQQIRDQSIASTRAYYNELVEIERQYNEQRTIDEETYNLRRENALRVRLANEAAIKAQADRKEKEREDDARDRQIATWASVASQGTSIFGQLADSMKKDEGKQSSSYKAMFALQKGFAIASSLLAAQQAYIGAFADPSAMTLPQKFAGGMAVMGALMPAITTLMSANLGFANGGYTGSGGKYEPAGTVHKGEVVWSQSDIRRWGGVGNVESMRTGSPSAQAGQSGVSITVNVPEGYTAEESIASDGSVTLDVVKREISASWNKLSDPYSGEHKAVRRNFNVQPNRNQ